MVKRSAIPLAHKRILLQQLILVFVTNPQKETKTTPEQSNFMTNISCIYLGCVKDPCSTKAACEMHCDRMLLSNWLTVGWLHI